MTSRSLNQLNVSNLVIVTKDLFSQKEVVKISAANVATSGHQ